MLRVSAGLFKGLRLNTPRHLRATEGKVRQALFNILGDAVVGARVLDAYAGSGAFGIEALSRGAAFVVFVESDTEAVLAIRDNLARLEGELGRDAWRVVHLEVERGLRQLAPLETPFDIAILDPPYGSDEARKALNALVEYAIVSPDGIVAVEHHRRTALPSSIGWLQQRTQHRYGDTVLSLYQPLPGRHG